MSDTADEQPQVIETDTTPPVAPTPAPTRRARQKAADTLPVLVLRGYWPADGSDPLEPGETVYLPADEARNVVKLGIAERADAF